VSKREDNIRFVLELDAELSIALDHDLDSDGWTVLAAFGRAMLSAQLLEFTVFQVSHLDRKTPKAWERALAQIEGLLKQPTGDQAKGLRRVDTELAEDLRTAIGVRNKLAHQGLLTYRVDVAVRGEPAHEEARAMYRAIALFIDDVRVRLDAVADKQLDEIGGKDLDADDMEAIFESLQRWASRATFDDDDQVES
jgi:hypothetical protein